MRTGRTRNTPNAVRIDRPEDQKYWSTTVTTLAFPEWARNFLRDHCFDCRIVGGSSSGYIIEECLGLSAAEDELEDEHTAAAFYAFLFPRTACSFGMHEFASRAAHFGLEQCPWGDLESAAYTLLTILGVDPSDKPLAMRDSASLCHGQPSKLPRSSSTRAAAPPTSRRGLRNLQVTQTCVDSKIKLKRQLLPER